MIFLRKIKIESSRKLDDNDKKKIPLRCKFRKTKRAISITWIFSVDLYETARCTVLCGMHVISGKYCTITENEQCRYQEWEDGNRNQRSGTSVHRHESINVSVLSLIS